MGNPKFRSMNGELMDGATDGSYKKLVNNRTNVQDPDEAKAVEEKAANMRWPYGLYEAPVKFTGDGRRVIS